MKHQNTYAFSVSVKASYIADQSKPNDSQYVFSYTVTIVNTGNIAAQLISRHWVITDESQHIQEVKGLGVVGVQPLLEPNEQFEYTSGTMLSTASGNMHGSYQCVAVDGTWFEAIIEPFALLPERILH